MTYQAQLIILNGTSSAGKSSIAKAMQQKLPDCFLHFQMDMFWDMVPSTIDVSETNFPHLRTAILESMSVLLKHEHNVIFDTVITKGERLNKLRNDFKDHAPFIVAVKANQNIVDAREKARGDRKIGLAAKQAETIHQGVNYDFDIDTSNLTAEEAADKIIHAYKARLTLSVQ